MFNPYTARSKLSNKQCLAPAMIPVYTETAIRFITVFMIQFKRTKTTVDIIARSAQRKKYYKNHK